MTAGTLTSITYPTGGTTELVMEPNVLPDGRTWGGLRVQSIRNKNAAGDIVQTKTYQYESGLPALNITIAYIGNHVRRVYENETDPTYSGAFNFVDGASSATEYTYDQNGNMTKDLNKKISSIEYNLLNLPKKVTFQNGNTVDYSYNAAGERIGVTYGFVTSGATYTYCGNICYVEGFLNDIQIDGGYITFSGTTPIYHYFLKDHLGNNRVVCNTSGTIEQVNHYYPFGGFFGESTNVYTQRYKFNAKEFDRMHGLDWYNYGARYMSPDIGRFTTMDPMAEKYYNISPYAYCGNNPTNNIDINGDSITVDKFGENLKKNGSDNNVYMKDNGEYTYIGTIGKSININNIAKNVFTRNAKIAEAIKNPITFYNYVKTNGMWDLKNKNNTIWQYARTHKTDFLYGKEKLKAEDVGNFNFGVVARAYGIPERIALQGAGLYQIHSGTSSAEWEKWKIISFSTVTPSGIISTSRSYILLPPYGDDPIDQYWIKRGYNY